MDSDNDGAGGIIEVGEAQYKLGHGEWTHHKGIAATRSQLSSSLDERTVESDSSREQTRNWTPSGLRGGGGGEETGGLEIGWKTSEAVGDILVGNSHGTSSALRAHAHDVVGLSVASEAAIAAIVVLGVAIIVVVLHRAGHASNKKIREAEDSEQQWLAAHPEDCDHVLPEPDYAREINV